MNEDTIYWYDGITPMTRVEHARLARSREFVYRVRAVSGRTVPLEDDLLASLGEFCAGPPERKSLYDSIVPEKQTYRAPTYK